jgi:hypothetical protein
MSWHRPQHTSHCEVARIGDFFVEVIKFFAEGGGQEQCIKMGFGGNGAMVSPWSFPFFWGFPLFNFVSAREKRGGEFTHWTPYQC